MYMCMYTYIYIYIYMYDAPKILATYGARGEDGTNMFP